MPTTYTAPLPITLPAGFEAGIADHTGATAGPGYAPTVDDMIEAGMAVRWTTNAYGNYNALITATAMPQYGLATYPKRGAIGTPVGGTGYWIVENSRVRRLKGRRGVMTINWLGAFVLPPDDADIRVENSQPRIERHPLFGSLTPLDFSVVQQAAQAPNAAMRNVATQALPGTSNPQLATLLYNKILRGQETFYYPGQIRYEWTTHYYASSLFGTPVAPALFLGPLIQSPAVFGAVPLISQLPAAASYLREADRCRFVGGLEAVISFTRTWVGAYNAWWDGDLYT